MTAPRRGGPLAGVKVLEVGGIGPNPFAAMMLADLGADVLRLRRPGTPLMGSDAVDPVNRGRPCLEVDVKAAAGRDLVLRLAESADALIEGYRPGVMERLGLGPDDALARNPRLVYGRVTGYGQDGPLSQVAGHDINYIAIAGALGAMARAGERPLFPLNLVGDYGGGAVMLAFGVVCALLEARTSGQGQMVDASMVDGVALLTTAFHGFLNQGLWSERPGTNILDSGAHFYEVYETADGGHMAIGAVEPQFYAELLRLLEIDPATAPQWDQRRWPELKLRFAAIFRTRTRAQWTALLEPAEACATPVLSLREAADHPHNAARGTFGDGPGGRQPRPAPRFSRTPAAPSAPAPEADVGAVLAGRWGLSADEIAAVTPPQPQPERA
jgi:alpha-methylacyl-CoA racemase